MERKVISTENAPKAIGPYSQAIEAGKLIFISGQLGINPLTGKLVDGIENQTKQALNNIEAILKSAGSSLEDVVKVTVFLKNISDFKEVNEIYSTYFQSEPPARSCIEINELPLEDALIEIEAVAKVTTDR